MSSRLGGLNRVLQHALREFERRVLLDRRDGEVSRIVAATGRLGADEAFRSGADLLDAYANSLYRSVKNHRDGNPLAATPHGRRGADQALEVGREADEGVGCVDERFIGSVERP
ncbi:hypothetical protein ABZW10_21420 [Kitasatospora sp. NPDC004723]|uniref:hypothetical protein n=1 Tax=Kitasatospora sp. NPDC004723 TaxID=3154288 RepID=UPI0033B51E72